MNRFDEMFNEFFNNEDDSEEDDMESMMREEMSRMIEMMSNLQNYENFDEFLETQMGGKLGEPNEIEFFERDGESFERHIWFTKHGVIIKDVYSDEEEPVIEKSNRKGKPLQEQLDEAVAKEDYDKAAKIRDLISAQTKENSTNG